MVMTVHRVFGLTIQTVTEKSLVLLETDRIRASVWVVEGSGDWSRHAPFVPDFCSAAATPEVDGYVATGCDVDGSLEIWC